MPFIDLRITVPVEASVKEQLKNDMGQAVTTLNKSESYLMVGIEDSCDLWLGGRKLQKGAYVSVSLYGNALPSDYNTMTSQICGILNRRIGIPGDAVYVTYHPVNDWGWNGRNF